MKKIEFLRANRALSDSMSATFSMQYAAHAVDWRFMYIVAITTLRAVGHVLYKIDCKRYPEIKNEVDERYKRWKCGHGDDELFIYFIEDARNILLKTYGFTNSDDIL